MELKLNNKGMSLIEIIISIALISIVLIFIFSLLVNVKDINTESELNSANLVQKALMISDIEDDLMNSTKLVITSCGDQGVNSFHPQYAAEVSGYKTSNQLDRLASMCIKFEISRPDPDGPAGPGSAYQTYAHLAIHYCTNTIANRQGYKISYIAEDGGKYSRDLPDFEKNNVTTTATSGELRTTNIPSIIYGSSSNGSTGTITFEKNSTSSYEEFTMPSSKPTLTLESSLASTATNEIDYAVIRIPVLGTDGKDYTYLISYHLN